MIARTCKRQALLALCLLPALAAGDPGMCGQQNHLRQSGRASRRTPTMSSAMRGQHRPASPKFSSLVPQGPSLDRMQSRHVLNSPSGGRAAGSVHLNPVHVSTGSGRLGNHDFNRGMGLPQQGSWAGRSLQFPGLFAGDHRNPASVQQIRRPLAGHAAVADPERPDRRVGRERDRFSFPQRSDFSRGPGRSGARSDFSHRQR